MKGKHISILVLVILIPIRIFSQETYVHLKGNLKIKKEYNLKTNTLLLDMAKQNNVTNLIATYIGTKNENIREKAIIYNINIYLELSFRGNNASKKYLEHIIKGLKTTGLQYAIVNYQGVPAIEYKYNMNGIPSMILCFLKNEKSYFIQVSSLRNLSTNFNSFKSQIIIH